ncbi:MAG: flagellar biosynthetic protein FliR [Burkholderiaceae bacterium]
MVTISSAVIAQWLASWLWPFIRILALLSTAPVFENRAVTRRVRIALAALIAILLGPLLPVPPAMSDTQALIVLLQQIMIGISLGFTLRIIFTAIEMAGDLLGLQMGLAFAQFIDPQRAAPSPVLGSFLSILTSLAFLAADGHLMIIDALVKSFEIVPISASFDFLDTHRLASFGTLLFSIALQIALPVIAALLTANVVLGILAKAAPQMNITSVGFAVTLLAGFWILWMSLPYLSTVFEQTTLQVLQTQIWRRR